MTKLIAINSIERGAKAKPSRVNPGELWDATAEEVAQLIPMRAAREPSEKEVALADAKIAKSEPVEPAKTDNAERLALEAKAKELDVKFSANISDEKLAERINEAETKVNNSGDLV